MKPDMRICRTHGGLVREADKGCFNIQGTACDPVAVRWSADRTALLVIEECDHVVSNLGLYGGSVSAYSPKACPKCGGEGWQYAARVRSGKTQMAIAGDSYNEGWSDALDARDTDRVAVVPL